MLVAEKQPVAARRAQRAALLQERAERRDAGSRPHHDDRRRKVRGETEAVRALHKDWHRRPGLGAVGEKDRGHTGAQPRALLPPHRRDREVDRAAVLLWRGRNRIEPRLCDARQAPRRVPARAAVPREKRGGDRAGRPPPARLRDSPRPAPGAGSHSSVIRCAGSHASRSIPRQTGGRYRKRGSAPPTKAARRSVRTIDLHPCHGI